MLKSIIICLLKVNKLLDIKYLLLYNMGIEILWRNFMKKLVMFDLDGTVLDTEQDLLICANLLFEKCGYPQIDINRVKEANGKDAVGYMNTLMGGNASLEEINKVWVEYLDLLAVKGADNTKVFDGLEEVLFSLKDKGYVLVILTNKSEEELPIFKEKILNSLPFDEIIAVGGTEDAKPKPNAILKLLKNYNVEKENAFMVGDGLPDIITAINAGVVPVAVLWGNRTKEELAEVGATIFAKETCDLLDIIG